MSKSLTNIWFEEFTSKDGQGILHCGLCGNRGVVHVEGMETPARQRLEVLHTYCICPNGRAMKRKKSKI